MYETTPLLVGGHVSDEEAAAFSTLARGKKGAQQVAALMLITTVWPFTFEMTYPFINQVRFHTLR